MKIEKQLMALTADLVTGSDDFVLRLFDKPAGEWISVSELSQNLEIVSSLTSNRIHDEVKRIHSHKKVEGEMYVTWLDFPVSLYGAGYALIIFFLDTPFWNTVAIYNRALLLKKIPIK